MIYSKFGDFNSTLTSSTSRCSGSSALIGNALSTHVWYCRSLAVCQCGGMASTDTVTCVSSFACHVVDRSLLL
jgi:hypothetical protein